MPCQPPPATYDTTDTRARSPSNQQQQPSDDQRASETTRARAVAAAFAARKQWDAKALSFQRGLEHVRQCHAGDACGSSLCHSTRRLMRTYATHPCPSRGTREATTNTKSTPECRVCKLWDYLMAKQQPLPATQPTLQRSIAQQGPVSCGRSLIQPRRSVRPTAALHRQITTAQKEARIMARRF